MYMYIYIFDYICMDIFRTSYDFNTSHCPDHQVMGQTGAVSPGLCGTARAATEGEEQALVSGHFGCAKSVGLSENSVPLHPMVNDHYPY